MSRHSEDSTASTVPPALVQGRPDVDVQALVAYRRQRLRQEMRRADVAMTLLTSPVSLRYVADFRDYALFQSHIPIFYAFIDLDGPVVIHGARGQSSGTGYRARLARGISAFNAGARLGDPHASGVRRRGRGQLGRSGPLGEVRRGTHLYALVD